MADKINTDNFREHLSNVTDKGKRVWIFPKIIKGKFYKYRTWFSWLLLALLFSGPFIKIGGRPLLLLDVIHRKFVIFGKVFWPQDFFIFAIGTLVFIVFIVVFTVIFGRVFCGWACPQTIFMEMVFRKIENWIEGNANKQKKLKEMPWNAEKVVKKGSKHTIFFFISFLIANTFLAYIIGIEELKAIITDPPKEHIGGLISILVFSTAFYLVFSKMRELVCTMACPYGRLQSVMLDNKSIIVAYDFERGEPRGKIKKGVEQNLGDCVDCNLCVDVCPTGIDIRNGTQMECVNCTACIDACDSVMEKVNRPKGLIRYASIEGITQGKKLKFNGRLLAYSTVLVLLIAALVFMLVTRSDIETKVLRTRGQLFQEQPDNRISNLYSIELANKTFDDWNIELKLADGFKGGVRVIGDSLVAKNSDITKGVFFVEFNKDDLDKGSTEIELEVWAGGELKDKVKTTFLAPIKK